MYGLRSILVASVILPLRSFRALTYQSDEGYIKGLSHGGLIGVTLELLRHRFTSLMSDLAPLLMPVSVSILAVTVQSVISVLPTFRFKSS